jgi:hypothetical protein
VLYISYKVNYVFVTLHVVSGLAYFGAIEAFGVEKAVISCFKQDGSYAFIQTHLIGCAKEKNTRMFGELMQVISSKSDLQTGFTMSPAGLDKIIHFKNEADQKPLFNKTALMWAIENSDQYMAIELLKLEHDFHQTEREGLVCLRDNLSSHELLPWIFETYRKYYDKHQYWRSLRIVIIELVLLSYIPYIMDIYFDITLAHNYRQYSRENFSLNNFWSCGETKHDSSCYKRICSDRSTRYHIDYSQRGNSGPVGEKIHY